MKSVKFLPSLVPVPWKVGDLRLPFGKGLIDWVHTNYFENISDIELRPNQTPRGNGYEFQVQFVPSSYDKVDWTNINYFLSDMKVSKSQKGYSYWNVLDYTVNYIDGVPTSVMYSVMLDEYITFFDNVLEEFKGDLTILNGHKHIWKKVDEEHAVPMYFENNGLSMCDKECSSHTQLTNEIQAPKGLNQHTLDDYLLFFFTGSRGNLLNHYVSNGVNDISVNPYTSSDIKNTGGIYTYQTKNSTTIKSGNIDKGYSNIELPYYIIAVPFTPIMNVNGIIDVLGNVPSKDGEGFINALLDNKKLGFEGESISNTYWDSIYTYLKEKGSYKFGPEKYIKNETELFMISPMSFGANLKIENILLVSLPNNTGTSYAKWGYNTTLLTPLSMGYKIPAEDEGRYHRYYIDGKITTINNKNLLHPYIKLQPIILPFLGRRWTGDTGGVLDTYYDTYNKDWTTKSPFNADFYYKNLLDFSNDNDIIEIKESSFKIDDIKNGIIDDPHLLTINHYNNDLISINGNKVSLDLQDFYFNNNNNGNIKIDNYKIINIDKSGVEYVINTAKYKSQNISKDYILNDVNSYIYPYGDNQFNDFMRQRLNALQTGRDNATREFETSKSIAERNYKQNLASTITNGVFGLITNPIKGISAVLSGNVGEVVNNTIGQGQTAIDMGFGIKGSINKKQNAIGMARMKEQNQIASINATVNDSKNSVANIGNAESGNTIETKLLSNHLPVNTLYQRKRTVSQVEKDFINYIRKLYGDPSSRMVSVESLSELMVMKGYTFLRMGNVSQIIEKMNIPQMVKETLTFAFESGVQFFNISMFDRTNIFDYNISNYDLNLEEEGVVNYEFKK